MYYQQDIENVRLCVNAPWYPKFSICGINCQYVVRELVCGAGFGATLGLIVTIPLCSASGVNGPAAV